MKIDYIIKELTKEDLNLDKEGFLDTLRNLSETKELSLGELEKLLSNIQNQNGHVYIAVNGNKKIIGTAKLLIEQKFSHSGGKVGHIEDVVTHEEYFHKGIASNLIETIISVSKKQGCYKVILDCKEELVPFYSKFGFSNKQNCLRLNII